MVAILVTGCTVRLARADEAAALAELGRRLFAATFARDNDPAQLERYLATAYTPELQAAELADPAVTSLLACDAAGTLVGFAQLRRIRPPACVLDASALELQRFYVDQAWHGRGVAPMLMRAVCAAAAAVARTLWLGVWERNLRAQGFYLKIGFTPVGTQTFMFGTEAQTDQIWVLPLQ